MSYLSILFPNSPGGYPNPRASQPDHFVDLNLDQVVAAIVAGKEFYDLEPFFHTPVEDLETIAFRLEMMGNLEEPGVRRALSDFAGSMGEVRARLARAENFRHPRQKERWFLDAVDLYGLTLSRLAEALAAPTVTARGLQALRRHLSRYLASPDFQAPVDRARALIEEVSRISYVVTLRELEVEVAAGDVETDYSADMERLFARFQEGPEKNYDFPAADYEEFDSVESRIADLLTKIFRETFERTADFQARNAHFPDGGVLRFDRELQFYISYLDYIDSLRAAGLAFCRPQVVADREEIHCVGGFDMALAGKLLAKRAIPVANDFRLTEPERIIVVSGPNQGGKTTFARAFGQMCYLANLGCPTAGSSARLPQIDALFTHFERGENTADRRGKLRDDLIRVRAIVQAATPRSLVILNEIFTSTTLSDAIALSRRIYETLARLDLLCVWVTFVEELTRMGARTVSMVSTVQPDDLAKRTYKIVRQAADGKSYAATIAERHGLTYDQIKARLSA